MPSRRGRHAYQHRRLYIGFLDMPPCPVDVMSCGSSNFLINLGISILRSWRQIKYRTYINILMRQPKYKFGYGFSSLHKKYTTMDIPKDQKGVVFAYSGAPLEYKTIPVPQVGHDEVLVNIKYTGVCHTDLHAWKGILSVFSFDIGDWPPETKPNLVGGHEGAGIAVAVGSNVIDVKVGDHVGIKVVPSRFRHLS